MKTILVIITIILLSIGSREALAFWESRDNETKSGLNVSSGFDVNTITTINGAVIDPPESKASHEPVVLSLATSQGQVTVIIGPRWFWEQQGITFLKNQEITVTGSRAQGKDGSFYIFAQRIETRTDGRAVTLRSENGIPLWSRGNGNQGGSGQHNGNGQPRSGGQGRGMRGGRH